MKLDMSCYADAAAFIRESVRATPEFTQALKKTEETLDLLRLEEKGMPYLEEHGGWSASVPHPLASKQKRFAQSTMVDYLNFWLDTAGPEAQRQPNVKDLTRAKSIAEQALAALVQETT